MDACLSTKNDRELSTKVGRRGRRIYQGTARKPTFVIGSSRSRNSCLVSCIYQTVTLKHRFYFIVGGFPRRYNAAKHTGFMKLVSPNRLTRQVPTLKVGFGSATGLGGGAKRLTQLLVALGLLNLTGFTMASPSLEIGQRFPDIVLPSLEDGSAMSIERFRGEKLLLHIFASW